MSKKSIIVGLEIGTSSIDWAKLSRLLPEEEESRFWKIVLKQKQDNEKEAEVLVNNFCIAEENQTQTW
jgi:hypothetical protein